MNKNASRIILIAV